MRVKYDEIRAMTPEQMADELLLVATWDKGSIKRAKESYPGGLHGFILDVLTTPLPEDCAECETTGWYRENGKCAKCSIPEGEPDNGRSL